MKKLSTRAAAVALGGALVAGGTFMFDRDALAGDSAAEAGRKAAVRMMVEETPVERDGKMVTSFAEVVEKVSPSVVKVYTTMKAREVSQEQMNPFFNDPAFRRFFGERFGDQFGGRGMVPEMPAPRREGMGSGVIVTKDGYILTNNHVVENADEVKVQVGEDGEEFTAKVVGTDPKTDIAVLKIENGDKSFPAVTVADSELIKVGDVVLAVGNPFGIGQTVTMGIVSATGRATLGMEYEDFIQTDAAINPGNSGGALVDAEGRLIGINTAIISRSGGNQGIGFAVPMNLARTVMESLIEHGRVVRGFMGVNIQDVNPALAREFDLEENKGALVSDVTEDSPAEKAGIKTGDVIVEFDGKDVRDSRNLKLQVAQIAPGEEVPLKVVRNGKVRELEITLKEYPSEQLAAKGSSKKKGSFDKAETEVLSGITVGEVDARARKQFEIPGSLKGALVTDVDAGSPAYEAGLRPGDIIQEIERKPVKDAEEAIAMSENLEGDSVLLKIWSRGGSRFLVVKNEQLG